MTARNMQIVSVSNFADETYAEKQIIGPWLSQDQADRICAILNEGQPNSRDYYVPKVADYVLWRGMEELI